MTNDLASMPVKDGFRLRGTDMTRIETFTDAAFAFAITLLILSGDVPADVAQLKQLLLQVPAFITSTILLMVFWYGHHDWSRRYGLDDIKTVVLSVGLVCTVLVYVYPLRLVAASFYEFIFAVAGWQPPSQLLLQSQFTVNDLFLIYNLGFVAMSAITMLLYMHAWTRRDELQLDERERIMTKGDIGAWSILAMVGLLSTIVSVLTDLPGSPGWVYMLLPIVMPIYGRRSQRAVDAVQTQIVSA